MTHKLGLRNWVQFGRGRLGDVYEVHGPAVGWYVPRWIGPNTADGGGIVGTDTDWRANSGAGSSSLRRRDVRIRHDSWNPLRRPRGEVPNEVTRGSKVARSQPLGRLMKTLSGVAAWKISLARDIYKNVERMSCGTKEI